eukprot:14203706-Alexandrium_andersonii.AAC.1
MSASLVGSEMCIRDSCRASAGLLQGFCRASSVLLSRLLQGFCRASAAVSYTHLTLPTICSV